MSCQGIDVSSLQPIFHFFYDTIVIVQLQDGFEAGILFDL